MSIQHHESSPEQNRALNKFMEQACGGTNRNWPNGRLGGSDDGETAFAIAADPMKRIIVIRFPKPMDWIGLDAVSATALRDKLNEKIAEISTPSK